MKKEISFSSILLSLILFIPAWAQSASADLNEYYKNKKVLVTGGYGFIGSHLVEKLVTLGAQVSVLDNFSTGKHENLVGVAQHVRCIQGDICNIQDCLDAAEGQEIIFHLAAHIRVVESLKSPPTCFDSNVRGTWNILEAARIKKVTRFIFSSSAAVYGNKEGICCEEDLCIPSSAYGLSKYVGEQLVAYYARVHGVPGISLRYFNVFGPRQDSSSPYSGVVAKFTQLLQEEKPLTIFGDGLQTRDFVPVDMVVDTNVNCAALDTEQLDGQAYNVATGKSITLLELIDQLRAQLKISYSPKLIFTSAREGEIRHSQAYFAKLDKLFVQMRAE